MIRTSALVLSSVRKRSTGPSRACRLRRARSPRSREGESSDEILKVKDGKPLTPLAVFSERSGFRAVRQLLGAAARAFLNAAQQRLENEWKMILGVLPDAGGRCSSTALFQAC